MLAESTARIFDNECNNNHCTTLDFMLKNLCGQESRSEDPLEDRWLRGPSVAIRSLVESTVREKKTIGREDRLCRKDRWRKAMSVVRRPLVGKEHSSWKENRWQAEQSMARRSLAEDTVNGKRTLRVHHSSIDTYRREGHCCTETLYTNSTRRLSETCLINRWCHLK
ncbi:hypothetical protein L5515_018657 [Caenorhabditis briggsae]|uniref:Uncharacterized protein n=1 Tax=Caenorhabditis briggsae TaxID=6238 RepID=A0AAE9FGF2_CAEBR|nr:hypothetical protein L5515_018657 [Caenorhabditis briggsae]